jgi:hypothetical protein
MCVIPLCVVTKIIGTIKAVQHNFQFIQRVLLSITLYTTCFGTVLVPSCGVSVEPCCTGRYCSVIYIDIPLTLKGKIFASQLSY